jgi:orotate phosphoribosyltransferase
MIGRRDVLKGEELKKRLRGIPMQTSMYGGIHYKLVQTWCIYSDELLFKSVVFGLKELIEKEIGANKFDCICAVPPCGTPLAASLSLVMEKPLIVPLPQDFAIMGTIENFHCEGRIEHGKRILLVDSISNSGASARNTMEQLGSIDGTFIGLAVVLSNDTFPEKRSDEFKKDYRSDIKYLFTVSEL